MCGWWPTAQTGEFFFFVFSIKSSSVSLRGRVTLDRDTPTLPTEKTRPKNIEKKIKRNKIR
jgi:hypothetical protein